MYLLYSVVLSFFFLSISFSMIVLYFGEITGSAVAPLN